jgi:hypothetical protein
MDEVQDAQRLLERGTRAERDATSLRKPPPGVSKAFKPQKTTPVCQIAQCSLTPSLNYGRLEQGPDWIASRLFLHRGVLRS